MLDESKYYAHASEPRDSVTRSLFDFYCPVEEEFPCLTVERAGWECPGDFRSRSRRHENDGFASFGLERPRSSWDPPRARLGIIQDMPLGGAATLVG